MKALLLLITFVFAVSAASAQWSNKFSGGWAEKHFIYGSGDVLVGNYTGKDISVNYIYNNKFSVKFGFSASDKLASMPNFPLKSGEDVSSMPGHSPNENLENYHLMFGRVFRLDAKDKIRITVQGGPGISMLREPVVADNAVNSVFNPNTDVNYEKTKNLSFILNPKIEFPIGCILGLSAGPMVMINEDRTFFGASIGFMYGVIGCNSI